MISRAVMVISVEMSRRGAFGRPFSSSSRIQTARWTSPLGLEGLLTNQAPQEGRMAERRTRRSFTREFKAQAVKRLLDGGKGLSEVATELGIGTGQLSQWRTEHLAAGSAEALAVRRAEQAETQRLKREVKRLEEEVEILRKAAAFFAKGIA